MSDHVATSEPSEVREETPSGTPGAEELVDRGECPICGVEFEDATTFRAHLGDVHDLHDDEGAETTLWAPLPIVTIDPVETSGPLIPEPPPRRQAPPPPPPPASKGLVAFLVLLLVFGAALVKSVGFNGPSDVASDVTLPALAGASTPTSAAPSPAASPDAGSPAVPAVGATEPQSGGGAAAQEYSAPTGDTVPAGDPAVDPAPTTTAPSTTPTTAPPPPPPPPSFAAPTTANARVDGCTKQKGEWIVTYSWQFVGGSAWTPLPRYKALGGGRYENTVKLPVGGTYPITKVSVLDASGVRHDIVLTPPLSTSSC